MLFDVVILHVLECCCMVHRAHFLHVLECCCMVAPRAHPACAAWCTAHIVQVLECCCMVRRAHFLHVLEC